MASLLLLLLFGLGVTSSLTQLNYTNPTTAAKLAEITELAKSAKPARPCRHNERVCPHEYTEGRIVVPTRCPLVLECWDNGLFAPNQCRSDGMCFCVNVT